MWRPSLTATLVVVCLAGVAGLSAQETTASLEPGTTEEIIEQILDLREKLDVLLQSLPAEMREVVERRWRERQVAKAATSSKYVPQPESTGRLATATPPAPELPPPAVPAPQIPAPEPEIPVSETPPPQIPPPAPEQIEPAAVLACDNLTVFDTTEDSLVSGADRYWRYLRLWLDEGDGNLESEELQSLFDLDIREIGAELKFYTKPDGTAGDVWVDEVIHLDLVGTGPWSGRSGVLVVDADRVARGGEHRLVDDSGASLTGYQPLRSDVALESADGSRTPLLCP